MSSKIRPLWANFTYFEHQIDGINWMLDKEINGTSVPDRNTKTKKERLIRGGFQCDDMGLGKTIQIASVIVNNPLPSTLLLVPLAMIDTWSGVLLKAGCAVYEISKSGDWILRNDGEDYGDVEPVHKSAVYISNYEKLSFKSHLFNCEWDRIVLDESHKIRNGDSDVSKKARKLKASIRWAVTGTPLVNSLKDIVSQLAFLGVDYSPLWRWEPRYLRIIPKILIHRSLDSLRSVIKDAPPIPEIHNINIPFSTKEEEEFYLGVQGAVTEGLANKYRYDLLNAREAFILLLRLRQISVHPQVYINAKRREGAYHRDDWGSSSTKLTKIKEIIERDDDSNTHKYIIFCQFNDEMSLIHDFLVENNIVADENILHYKGSMTQRERGLVLTRSKETTDTTVMLLQLQAGGVGLNLQEYDRILFMSPWWTSALMDQAIARAVRMGQKQCVKVYHLRLAAEHETAINIDTLINDKADEKRKMQRKLFSQCPFMPVTDG